MSDTNNLPPDTVMLIELRAQLGGLIAKWQALAEASIHLAKTAPDVDGKVMNIQRAELITQLTADLMGILNPSGTIDAHILAITAYVEQVKSNFEAATMPPDDNPIQ